MYGRVNESPIGTIIANGNERVRKEFCGGRKRAVVYQTREHGTKGYTASQRLNSERE